jgi:hypothetical protein
MSACRNRYCIWPARKCLSICWNWSLPTVWSCWARDCCAWNSPTVLRICECCGLYCLRGCIFPLLLFAGVRGGRGSRCIWCKIHEEAGSIGVLLEFDEIQLETAPQIPEDAQLVEAEHEVPESQKGLEYGCLQNARLFLLFAVGVKEVLCEFSELNVFEGRFKSAWHYRYVYRSLG